MRRRPIKHRVLMAVRKDQTITVNQIMEEVFGPLASDTFTVVQMRAGQEWSVACGVFLDEAINEMKGRLERDVDSRKREIWDREAKQKLIEEGFSEASVVAGAERTRIGR